MTQSMVMQLGQEAARMTLLMAGPILGVSLLVGLAISIFQAVTQINEMTLSFVPKLLAIFGLMFFIGPWLISQMTGFTSRLLQNLPSLVR